MKRRVKQDGNCIMLWLEAVSSRPFTLDVIELIAGSFPEDARVRNMCLSTNDGTVSLFFMLDSDGLRVGDCPKCNAEWIFGKYDYLKVPMKQLLPGEVVPVGSCPSCGSLVRMRGRDG